MSACNCIGPQQGQPVCPCRMRNVKIIDGRYVTTTDLGPAPNGGLPKMGFDRQPQADWVHKESSTRVIDLATGKDLGSAD